MKTRIICCTFCILLLVPALVQADGEFVPTLPRRGEPPLLSFTAYPVEKWRSRSETNFQWFVMKTNGWYIDFDCERRPITHLVVHHTAGSGKEQPGEISETVCKRVYGADPKFYSVFRDPKSKSPYVCGLPIHSGHVVDGVETFTGYHFLIYPDGKIVTTLVPHRKVNGVYYPDMIAWGAGNWPVNCASVQIALAGTWSKERPPTNEALALLMKIIGYYRAQIPSLKVVGHGEVRLKPTECPGDWWSEWTKNIR